jgi:branched-chain amino acid transport system ATP-binding protein
MTVLENVVTGAYLGGTSGFMKCLFCSPGKMREEKRIQEEAFILLREIGLENRDHLLASALPFGQQRLLEIARALAARPKVILLDEPAAGLNAAETESLAAYLKTLRDKGILRYLLSMIWGP